jgi:hypothetical protein
MKHKYNYFDITLGITDLNHGIYYEIYLYVSTKPSKPIRCIQIHYATESKNMQTSLSKVLYILQDLNPNSISIISSCNFDNAIDKIKDFKRLTGIHVTYDEITRYEKN